MKVMHVDASPKHQRSNSRALARYFLDRFSNDGQDIEVDYLDVTVETPAHPTELFSIATYTAPELRTSDMEAELAASDSLCERLLSADALLFAMPMHNFNMPSSFKAFVDNIVRAGLTYEATTNGYQGCLGGKPALFITARGADLRPGSPLAHMDALTPALKSAFGFIGVSDATFVDAQPLQFADEKAREDALDRARAELDQVSVAWAKLLPKT